MSLFVHGDEQEANMENKGMSLCNSFVSLLHASTLVRSCTLYGHYNISLRWMTRGWRSNPTFLSKKIVTSSLISGVLPV